MGRLLGSSVCGLAFTFLTHTRFSVVRTSEGCYTITFNTPFAGPPSITAIVDYAGGYSTSTEISTNGVTSSSVNLVMSTNYYECGSCNPLDSPFHFIAIGPR